MKVSIMLILMFSSSLATATEQVNFFWQAPLGIVNFNPSVSSTDLEIRSSFGAVELDTTIIAARLEYGLLENFSVGVRLPYSTSDISTRAQFGTSNSSVAGLSDWEIEAKAFLKFGQITMRYGADLSLSIEDSKEDANGDPTNQYSGGHKLTPYLGFDLDLGDFYVGTIISRDVNIGDRTTDSNGIKANVGGAERTNINIFAEYHVPHAQLGVSAGITNFDPVTTASSTVARPDFWIYSLYANINLNDHIDLIPTVVISDVKNKNYNGLNFEKYGATQYGLQARFMF